MFHVTYLPLLYFQERNKKKNKTPVKIDLFNSPNVSVGSRQSFSPASLHSGSRRSWTGTPEPEPGPSPSTSTGIARKRLNFPARSRASRSPTRSPNAFQKSPSPQPSTSKRTKRADSYDSIPDYIVEEEIHVVRPQGRVQQRSVRGKTDRLQEKKRESQDNYYVEKGASNRRKDKRWEHSMFLNINVFPSFQMPAPAKPILITTMLETLVCWVKRWPIWRRSGVWIPHSSERCILPWMSWWTKRI